MRMHAYAFFCFLFFYRETVHVLEINEVSTTITQQTQNYQPFVSTNNAYLSNAPQTIISTPSNQPVMYTTNPSFNNNTTAYISQYPYQIVQQTNNTPNTLPNSTVSNKRKSTDDAMIQGAPNVSSNINNNNSSSINLPYALSQNHYSIPTQTVYYSYQPTNTTATPYTITTNYPNTINMDNSSNVPATAAAATTNTLLLSQQPIHSSHSQHSALNALANASQQNQNLTSSSSNSTNINGNLQQQTIKRTKL